MKPAGALLLGVAGLTAVVLIAASRSGNTGVDPHPMPQTPCPPGFAWAQDNVGNWTCVPANGPGPSPQPPNLPPPPPPAPDPYVPNVTPGGGDGGGGGNALGDNLGGVVSGYPRRGSYSVYASTRRERGPIARRRWR